MTAARSPDQRTRQRILDAATRAFAARGFKHVTVRAICLEAGANVAAVNYHFRSKLGLYREVLDQAVAAVQETTREAMALGEGLSAEGRLQVYVRVHCERLYVRTGKAGQQQLRLQQMMHREMHDPTPALTAIVDRAIRPRFEYLASIVAELLDLPIDDQRTVQSVVSVHAQVILFRPNPMTDRLRGAMKLTFSLNHVIDHIVRFSLAGIRGLSH